MFLRYALCLHDFPSAILHSDKRLCSCPVNRAQPVPVGAVSTSLSGPTCEVSRGLLAKPVGGCEGGGRLRGLGEAPAFRLYVDLGRRSEFAVAPSHP